MRSKKSPSFTSALIAFSIAFGMMAGNASAADYDPSDKGAIYSDDLSGSTVQMDDTGKNCDQYSLEKWCRIFNADGGDGPDGDGCESGGEAS